LQIRVVKHPLNNLLADEQECHMSDPLIHAAPLIHSRGFT
jgi:hypothetical protein